MSPAAGPSPTGLSRYRTPSEAQPFLETRSPPASHCSGLPLFLQASGGPDHLRPTPHEPRPSGFAELSLCSNLQIVGSLVSILGSDLPSRKGIRQLMQAGRSMGVA